MAEPRTLEAELARLCLLSDHAIRAELMLWPPPQVLDLRDHVRDNGGPYGQQRVADVIRRVRGERAREPLFAYHELKRFTNEDALMMAFVNLGPDFAQAVYDECGNDPTEDRDRMRPLLDTHMNALVAKSIDNDEFVPLPDDYSEEE